MSAAFIQYESAFDALIPSSRRGSINQCTDGYGRDFADNVRSASIQELVRLCSTGRGMELNAALLHEEWLRAAITVDPEECFVAGKSASFIRSYQSR